ncbi:MAG: 1-acyl-sn-glycerol-3-phosphate acyltransferase [Holosporales bacterium]|jgi:1-acyl-sn-glycerol-3-phosphate acyltransferase|nr:1-acyl-sn-glycerol-3-phosphate acyltransferase [Holosporales bacterium]
MLKTQPFIRATLFYVLFVMTVFPVVIACWPLIFISRRVPFFIFATGTKMLIVLMRTFLGIRVRFENLEILRKLQQDYPCFILAPKHQSEIETLIFSTLLKSFRIIYKKEINKVPFVSSYMQRMNFIAIDRTAGRKTIQSLIDEGLQSVADNVPILIFPEGTRTAFGERGRYHAGVALMYDAMKVPILPVAHNAGQFFTQHSFVKTPGDIVFRFLPPILPGLSTRDALKELEAKIEGDM